MAPFNAAMQMALAQALRGAQPPPPQADVNAALGFEDDPMATQRALADAVAGRTAASSIPPGPSVPGLEKQAALASALAGGGASSVFDEILGGDLDATPGLDDSQMQEQEAARGAQQAIGNLGLLTGDRVLSRFGASQIDQSDKSSPLNYRGESLRQGALRLALAAEEAKRRKGEADRRPNEKKSDRAWQAEQRDLDRKSRERAAAITAGDKATQQQLDNEAKLRSEVQGHKVIQKYQLAAVAYEKVRQAAADPSPASDLALIFGYMKTLDPTSAVREGEFANAQNAGGIPDRVINAYNRAISGERLNPEQRAEFVRSAANQFQAIKGRAEGLIGGYRGIASDIGVSPERVIVPGTMVPIEDLPSGKRGQARPTPKPQQTSQAGRPARADKKLDPGRKEASRTYSKDGKWMRVVYTDGTYGLAPSDRRQ
ncbi:virion structural protein [Myxococcus phage Mx8]|uniref:Virion structural protein n=1 Tax=Myxococcus phage Mx8 TaxID=49964 RepID=Q94MR3_9CAUD|nr:virion structural protein [Myxococcus phage Mx8]AAK94391.1 virion structural protein [Myxococcus phage Mx8]